VPQLFPLAGAYEGDHVLNAAYPYASGKTDDAAFYVGYAGNNLPGQAIQTRPAAGLLQLPDFLAYIFRGAFGYQGGCDAPYNDQPGPEGPENLQSDDNPNDPGVIPDDFDEDEADAEDPGEDEGDLVDLDN